MTVARWRSAWVASAVTIASSAARISARPSRACSTVAVSRMSCVVAPQWVQPPAGPAARDSPGNQADHGVADVASLLAASSSGVEVFVACRCGDRAVAASAGMMPRPAWARGQRRLHVQHALEVGGLVEHGSAHGVRCRRGRRGSGRRPGWSASDVQERTVSISGPCRLPLQADIEPPGRRARRPASISVRRRSASSIEVSNGSVSFNASPWK